MSKSRRWSYHLFQPRAMGTSERGPAVAAYACWQETWGAMLRDLDGDELRFADDFSRQDEIGALFRDDEFVGLSAYRFVDLSLPWQRRDSYFRAWPESMLEQIAAASPRVCVGSNLVVAPLWRGAIAPMRVSEMLLALAVQRYAESDAQVMLGTMRNDRRMNDLSYNMGAVALKTNVIHHNVAVDLVMFTRNTVDDVGLPPVRWVRQHGPVKEPPHDDRIAKLRRTAG
jgi:hypothetical protein